MEQNEVLQAEIYFCRKCYKETQTTNPDCSQCGRKMQTRTQIKSLGKLLIVLGIVISFCSGVFVAGLLAVLLFAEVKEEDISMIFFISTFFGMGLAAGIITIIGGKWQAKHGRTSKMFVWIFFGLVILMLVVGRIFSVLKG